MANSLLDVISADLSWREAELGSLKLLLSRADVSDHQRTVLLRASWSLLYAHYEGFAKTALTVFYDFASQAVANCKTLPVQTRIFALGKKVKALRGLETGKFLQEIESFAPNNLNVKPVFPDVDTKSNLWPNILEDLLADADISVTVLSVHRLKIATLVKRRNNIAHGQQEIVSEISYYREFESAVYDVMYEMAFKMDDRLKNSPYT